MKRLASALLALCMLATATPLSAFAQPVEESLPAAATQTADVSGSAPTEKPTAVPTEAAEAPVSTEETTGTPAPVPTDEATGTPTPVPTDEATGTPTPVPTDEATRTPTPVPTDEAMGTPTPVPTDETTGTPTPVPTDETAGTPAPIPTDEATGTPTPVPTDEATGTPTPVPTDAAEIKIITSFEAVAPEGLFASQGALETDLGLHASLSVQFTDDAVGEIPVTWQCAAGYAPNAEAGT